MMPRPIHLLITSVKFTSIRLASSLTLMNSVNCSLLPSSLSPAASAASSRLALRYFAFKLLPLPPAPASLPCLPLSVCYLLCELCQERFFHRLQVHPALFRHHQVRRPVHHDDHLF